MLFESRMIIMQFDISDFRSTELPTLTVLKKHLPKLKIEMNISIPSRKQLFMSTRRTFIKQTTLATSGLFLMKGPWSKPDHLIGLQLYTVRTEIDKDVEDNHRQSCGYRVQLSRSIWIWQRKIFRKNAFGVFSNSQKE